MWDFNTGASTLGLQDLSVTNAKITNLTADKITTGTLTAFIQIGVGPQLFLDAANANLHVYDAQSPQRLRVMLGKLDTGVLDYGLRIWNGADPNELMWDLSGASTLGIQQFAVTESILFQNTGSISVSGTLQSLASVTFSNLNVGDQVWLVGMVTAGMASSTDRMRLQLNLQTLAGPILSTAIASGPIETSFSVQYVYQATGIGTHTFHLAFLSLAGGGAVSQITLTALRRKR
jgi:hypothetical protein